MAGGMAQLDLIRIAERFASALDAEDYATAAGFLSSDCEYSVRGRNYRGPAEIIASYKDHGDSAAQDFDEIDYRSEVRAAETGVAIRFIDRFSHKGRRFTFQCEQVVEIDSAGLICRIRHVDLPGQREGLEEFMKLL